MSLASAITTAQTIFSNTGKQTAIVSQNIANVGSADYSRRLAMMGVDNDGQPYLKVQRAQNDALFKQTVASISDDAGQSRLLFGLQQIQSAFGGADYPTSPSTYMTAFRSSLQTFAASPSSITIARSAVADARDVANALNSASTVVDQVKATTDKEIGEQVVQLNEYLSAFEKVNYTVIGMLANGKDASDALDKRDSLLKSIAGIVGISTTMRQSMDTVIYTSDGSVLFETSARKVELVGKDGSSSPPFHVEIDNEELKPGTGGNTTAQGTLAALFQLRDDIAPMMQNQLDEIARGLIVSFRETDQTIPEENREPGVPGLFIDSSSTDMPTAGTISTGLAGRIKINAAVDDNPMLLRDGGFNNTSTSTNYTYNRDSVAAYTGRLDGLIEQMGTPQAFDATADIGGTATVMGYASNSIGWIEQLRKAATSADETKGAMVAQMQQTLSNETGVSLDEELSLMLDLEQSYKASAKLLTTVDEMLKSLLDMVR
ncbi:flagellar hook-associated protein 1 FlgK [Rhizobium sp. PP-F2F-G38]|uniref:Flagellar hook-associated protein 1 n=1 Tax=Ferranicluibacter rubi TaxID=2715133 RepID=A0AA43ZAL8_9HYPH|nr:flagellar hook-associated protein FlgK [Ferranicluibacter rubi]PYE36338.1 flagellar hook-associated protein 1 FlgK [Rhizobium sp. PP-WC-1G-195]PYE99833.1 flagellar hook-associated protein 1 FlgK [Rhizobium sp. PP-F2F-G38]TCP89170.1 flagellar hook-associated protein 1 FlgK [Rhizobium sp. PP-CC-2G-626]TCQ11963.1 flagellar hook-associated protein 1 FlgK [Rhizobium sp. PP-F2F-G36]NHT74308.1 flagellar hook-associated protein FlgK [Ferranicluibacter rubi]